MKQPIYLDYAAATPLDPAVLSVMQPYFAERFYNPSALYLAAKEVKRDIEVARSQVARLIGARPGEVIFTAGGSESNNMAINGIMARFPGKRVVVSAVEHDSVREPSRVFDSVEASVNELGSVDIAKLESAINDDTVLVSVMYANNEIGTIQPIKEIASLVAKIRQQRLEQGNKLPLYLHSDACQASNYLDLHVSRLGVDLMSLNGGKIYGPKQSGILYVRAGIELEAMIRGGGQEMGLRSGTENVAGIIGFAEALEAAQAKRAVETRRLQELQRLFIEQIQQQVPGVEINGSRKKRLPNNVHVTIPGVDNERLLMQLDELGVICATGSACSASKQEASHVLNAIGLNDEAARSSLRFTMGRSTTEKDVMRAVEALRKSLLK